MVSRYVTNGPVKEGICLVPPPPTTHYRMMPPQRSEGFHVQTSYVPQQPQQQQQQPGNQGQQSLRGIAPPPAGPPPNQSSTPPTNDIKVQSVPQQQSMNHMFVGQQQTVRAAQGTYYRQSAGPPNQATRMPNQHRGQQQAMYPAQPAAQYMNVPMPVHQMYLNPIPYFNGQRPQTYTVQPTTQLVYGGQGIPAPFAFQPTPNQPQPTVPYPTVSYILRQGHQAAPPTQVAPNAGQQMQNMQQMNQVAAAAAVAASAQQQPPFQKPLNKRRPNALAVIDPDTGADRLDEVYQSNNSHPPSGESSARQTPQPAAVHTATSSHNKEVQAAFAKQVAQAIGSDEAVSSSVAIAANTTPSQQPVTMTTGHTTAEEQDINPQGLDHHHQHHHPDNVYVQQQGNNRIDPIRLAQTSNLKVQAKEFAPTMPPSNLGAKETPIVSAMCDSVEVTLPNKPAKDRESPAKSRKQREPQQQNQPQQPRIHKESGSANEKGDSPPHKVGSSNNNKEPIGVSLATSPPVAPVQIRDPKDLNRDEKRSSVKKDVKTDSGKVDSNNDSVSNQTVQAAQDVPTNAKSKNASQRSKDVSQVPQPLSNQQKQQPSPPPQPQPQPQQPPQQQQQQQLQQQQPQPPHVAVIPQPQPAKPSSKTSKKSELNQKGANKEGTDMDAFNDNNTTTTTNSVVSAASDNVDNVNANVNATSTTITQITNEINANSLVNNVPQQQAPIAAHKDSNKKNYNVVSGGGADNVKSAETKTVLPKTKIDITDIVKDKPKPFKNTPLQQQTAQEAQDETDKAAVITNDKLVQAKNEANAKQANSENNTTAVIETRPELPYKEDQWSPQNLDGKKKYDKDFLLALRTAPASTKKPDNIPDFVLFDHGRLSDGRYSMSGRTDFTPSFQNYGGKSSSQRGPLPKRGSQSGKVGSGNKGSTKQQVIKLSISVREDVKLHEVENAWKPARFFKTEAEMSDDDRKTEELYKRVRGVLNKLTPQKFDTLVGQVRALPIDTVERLQGVIDLVFEKAVDEPNFSVAYALMCRELALMQVTAINNSEELKEDKDKKEVINFRKLLVTRCQVEFEKQSYDESVRNEKVKVIDACTDPEKKKELQFELAEYDRKLRMKSVGNIRFIGELFKQQMLTVKIMLRCLQNLLDNKDEESLECLCKLLTTIGKELEDKKIDLSKIFGTMKDIVDKKHGRVNNRVRFMLQDVIDLRKGKWVPRLQDSNPKTIDQIQKEAENEHFNIQAMNSVPSTPRREERGGGGSSASMSSDRRNKRNVSDDGWQTQAAKGRPGFSVQSDKLKNKPPLTDEPLGSRQMFGNWSKGSNIKTDASAAPNTANAFAVLENMETEKRPTNVRPGNKDPYSSKGSSLERGNYRHGGYDSKNSSRSGSQHRSIERENVSLSQQQQHHQHQHTPQREISQQQQQQLQHQQEPAAAVAQSKSVADNVTSSNHILDNDLLERHMKNSLDEYLNDSCAVEEYAQDFQNSVPPNYYSRIINDGYNHVLERSSTARLRTGQLFAQLIKSNVLPLNDYCEGLEITLSQIEDLQIDIPKIWDYLAEIMVHLLCEEVLSLERLHKCSELVINQGYGAKFLAPLFRLVVSTKGPNFLANYWQRSALSLDKFMDPSQVESFLKDNKLEFLCGGVTPAGENLLSYEQIHDKLLEFFKAKTSFDDIVNWITANISDKVKENKFIRVLATSIFAYSIQRQKFENHNLQEHYRLLQKYVDNNPAYELQCLYALQALIHKMEHPQGILLQICNRLYEDSIISQESFVTWETSNDPGEQEGKGVAIKQLTSFFTQLRENEEDDYSSSEEA